ncbi:hypothetical protein EPN15_00845 [Patescibacteria group bacterium]|nr:MAG: hypothetical protein EPN15_00845 [Patescibacteria group bacterium]
MSRKLLFSIFISAAVLTLAGFVVRPALSQDGEPMTRKIIVYKNQGGEEKIAKHNGVKIKHLKSINADAVFLTPTAAKALEKDVDVLRVEDDILIEASDRKISTEKRVSAPPAQSTPWGIDRIDADLVWGITTGDPIKVAVIDTGIELSHPDLKNNIKGGYNAINPLKSANDDNGHGTHVAGIIAAENNSIGVIGAGPQIDLYAVKALDRRGSGYLSDIIEGIDWAIANGIKVINMSLGTTSNIQSFHDAIARANAAGIVQVAAAGNDGLSVNYPAAYPEVIAVSATDSADTITSWSSRGPEVDLAAPGLSIYSTYKGQTYKTLSGTSMATPHVAGTAALILAQTAKCDADSSGSCSSAEVQDRLQATATDLGISGPDGLYGYGLVNAYQAVTQ